MGHRSWITVVDGKDAVEFFELLNRRSKGNYDDDLDWEVWLSYAYKVNMPFGGYGVGRILLAWNSEGSGVLESLPETIQLDIVLLDCSVMSDWGKTEFDSHGIFLPDEEAVRKEISRWQN